MTESASEVAAGPASLSGVEVLSGASGDYCPV
jgi:hypothetical protein